MKQYYPEAEMCLEVTINNINNETKEDINMAAKNTITENKTAAITTPVTTDKEENTVVLEGMSVSFDWKSIFNRAKEHVSNGYTKGKTWAKEHPKHAAVGLGMLTLAALLKFRSKKSVNKK